MALRSRGLSLQHRLCPHPLKPRAGTGFSAQGRVSGPNASAEPGASHRLGLVFTCPCPASCCLCPVLFAAAPLAWRLAGQWADRRCFLARWPQQRCPVQEPCTAPLPRSRGNALSLRAVSAHCTWLLSKLCLHVHCWYSLWISASTSLRFEPISTWRLFSSV